MKTRPTIYMVLFFLISSYCFAQTQAKTEVIKRTNSLQMISGKTFIKKYHTYEELKQLSKGQLLNLYSERIKVIVQILPNIAFATNPNVTMESIGIPETKENKKALLANREASAKYFESTIVFQKKILPYSDKSDLIAAITFYEETLKSLHTYNEYKID